MKQTLSGPMVPPKSGKAKKAVVLLHGYGSDGNDLISLAQYWRAEMADTMFVAPNAPDRCDINPMGHQWFPLAVDRLNSPLVGVETARAVITEFLEALWAQTGLKAADTLLIGFSQGGMMALDVGLRLEQPLSGIVSFSGGLIGVETIQKEIKSKPPVCFIHGEADDVVPMQMSKAGHEALKRLDVKSALHLEPGVAHTISMEGLGFALAFMREVGGTSKRQ